MYPSESYQEDLEGLSFEQLINERNRLLSSITYFIQNPPKDDNCISPSPAAVHSMELEYFCIVCEYLRVHHFEPYKKVCCSTLSRSELIGIIDRTLKKIWLHNIVDDYSGDYLLKEDALKCAFYYHLRRNLASLLSEHNLRIYPEYYVDLAGKRYRVDIAIVQINADDAPVHLKDKVTDVLALIELKYTFGETKDVIASIKRDVSKMRDYVTASFNAQCYCAVLYESSPPKGGWVSKQTTHGWADGNLTILSADIEKDTEWFKVQNYNGLNKDMCL